MQRKKIRVHRVVTLIVECLLLVYLVFTLWQAVEKYKYLHEPPRTDEQLAAQMERQQESIEELDVLIYTPDGKAHAYYGTITGYRVDGSTLSISIDGFLVAEDE